MNQLLLINLFINLIVLCSVFVLLMRNRILLVKTAYGVKDVKALRATENIHAQLTNIRWSSEFLLEQSIGVLNFAQIQTVHEINDASGKAVENLRYLFEKFGLNNSVEVARLLKLEQQPSEQ